MAVPLRDIVGQFFDGLIGKDGFAPVSAGALLTEKRVQA
jgi:hypothetical protein